MKSIIQRFINFLKRFKTYIISIIIGIILGFITSNIFLLKVSNNFHFEGSSNWIQFLTDSTNINESFISIPNLKHSGLKGYANGEFKTVLMLKNAEFLYDSITYFEDLTTNKEYTKGFITRGKIEIMETAGEYITPVFFGFNEEESFYYKRYAKVKDYSEKEIDTTEELDKKKCNANLEFNVPVGEIITIKTANTDIEYCLTKKIPSEFFIENPLMYTEKLLNKFLPNDSCKTVLISVSSNDYTNIKIGSKNIRSMINGGKVKVNNITYEGDYLLEANLENQCNDVTLTNNKIRPFDIAISIEKKSNKSFFGIQSSFKYLFLTSPSGEFTIGNTHYSINEIDKLELMGDLQMNLIYEGEVLPKVSIEGTISSCKLNTIELLKSKWGHISSDIQGGIIGGIIGFILSLITLLLGKKN